MYSVCVCVCMYVCYLPIQNATVYTCACGKFYTKKKSFVGHQYICGEVSVSLYHFSVIGSTNISNFTHLMSKRQLYYPVAVM